MDKDLILPFAKEMFNMKQFEQVGLLKDTFSFVYILLHFRLESICLLNLNKKLFVSSPSGCSELLKLVLVNRACLSFSVPSVLILH